MTIVANVTKLLFGAPIEENNTGISKVRYATGIKCFKLGSQHPLIFDIILTPNADTNGIPITTNNADCQWYITVI